MKVNASQKNKLKEATTAIALEKQEAYIIIGSCG
jgi:hypothetical protein